MFFLASVLQTVLQVVHVAGFSRGVSEIAEMGDPDSSV